MKCHWGPDVKQLCNDIDPSEGSEITAVYAIEVLISKLLLAVKYPVTPMSEYK